ncbi:hypothetical protein ABZ714_22990 [Streptomyces sp. NPDC006798]|uniref:hypothetical protein n=1 Tax=Streptomyces sp. NPDC006798 TaxID=3155462 RepID=UPI0033DB3719
MQVRRTVRTALAGTMLALALPALGTTPLGTTALEGTALSARTAHAEPVAVLGDCFLGRICGNVYNRDNRHTLRITNDWGKRHKSSSWRTLKPGQNGRHVKVRDVDGFWVSRNCRVTVGYDRTEGPGWHKVYDGFTVKITDIRC